MANENVRIGDPALVFGIPDVDWGWLQNVRYENGPQKAECPNGQGNVVAVEYYRQGEIKVSGSCYFRKGKSTPAELVGTGTPIQFRQDLEQPDAPAGDYYVERVTKQYSSGNWVTLDFEAVMYPHLVNS